MTAETVPATGLSGTRARMHVAAIGLSGLMILAIWAAFLLAGSGLFGFSHHNVGDLDHETLLDPHRVVGNIIEVLALLLLLAVLVARPGRNLVWLTLGLFVLAGPVQPILAGVGADHRWVGGLHVLNGGVILALTFWVHLVARKVPRT